jgi:membrane-associated phospholipid phosphatase
VPSLALAWVLQSCYAAHYLIFPGVPVWLFVRRGREAAGRAIFAIAFAFFSCYLIYLAFPVAGPLLAYPWPSGPVVAVPPGRLVYALNAAGASWGTAFPSSHVAASWTAVLIAWRDARRLSLALMPVALGLALGTVYGQFHYAVDAVAGAGMALLALAVSDPLRTWLASRLAPIGASVRPRSAPTGREPHG